MDSDGKVCDQCSGGASECQLLLAAAAAPAQEAALSTSASAMCWCCLRGSEWPRAPPPPPAGASHTPRTPPPSATPGQVYDTPEELWAAARERGGELGWYTRAVGYWDKQEASDNGVLGGFGHVSETDVADSRAFLLKAFPRAGGARRAADAAAPLVALDCGAGVGRVSEQLLLHLFDEVDLVEPSGEGVCQVWGGCRVEGGRESAGRLGGGAAARRHGCRRPPTRPPLGNPPHAHPPCSPTHPPPSPPPGRGAAAVGGARSQALPAAAPCRALHPGGAGGVQPRARALRRGVGAGEGDACVGVHGGE